MVNKNEKVTIEVNVDATAVSAATATIEKGLIPALEAYNRIAQYRQYHHHFYTGYGFYASQSS